MTAEHNHPPRCCCQVTPDLDLCPACPEHGTPRPTVECPQCHQAAGRPHTDYCTLQLREQVFADPTYGQLGQTSQPATRTSQRPDPCPNCGFVPRPGGTYSITTREALAYRDPDESEPTPLATPDPWHDR